MGGAFAMPFGINSQMILTKCIDALWKTIEIA